MRRLLRRIVGRRPKTDCSKSRDTFTYINGAHNDDGAPTGLLTLPIEIREQIYEIVMRDSQHITPPSRLKVNCRFRPPHHLPAVCLTSKSELEVATNVYLRHVILEIQHSAKPLQDFLSSLSSAGTGFQAVRELHITCGLSRGSTRKGDKKGSAVHIELLNACSALRVIKFVVCMQYWNTSNVSLSNLKKFFEADKLMANKALTKLIFSLPTTHKNCKPVFLEFAHWFVAQYLARNERKMDIWIEWVRRG